MKLVADGWFYLTLVEGLSDATMSLVDVCGNWRLSAATFSLQQLDSPRDRRPISLRRIVPRLFATFRFSLRFYLRLSASGNCRAASCASCEIPYFSTCVWCSSRASSAVTAAVSPRSLPSRPWVDLRSEPRRPTHARAPPVSALRISACLPLVRRPCLLNREP